MIAGSLWMIGITLLLFFFPTLNGFAAGLAGGYKVGGPSVRSSILFTDVGMFVGALIAGLLGKSRKLPMPPS